LVLGAGEPVDTSVGGGAALAGVGVAVGVGVAAGAVLLAGVTVVATGVDAGLVTARACSGGTFVVLVTVAAALSAVFLIWPGAVRFPLSLVFD
jgi:hypothetical protein